MSTELLRQGKALAISAKSPALPAAGAVMEGSQEQLTTARATLLPKARELQKPRKQVLNSNMLSPTDKKNGRGF